MVIRRGSSVAIILVIIATARASIGYSQDEARAGSDAKKHENGPETGQGMIRFEVLRSADNTVTMKLAPGSKHPYPNEWVVECPPVKRVCPPTQNAYSDASRTVSKSNLGVFRHEPNGGWHRKGSRKLNGKEVLHVGMDIGLRRVGERVYAVADGVVRISEGPKKPDKKSKKKSAKGSSTKFNYLSGDMRWGNLIVIEHKFPNDEYYTSVYGHLGVNRLVAAGDTVKAGQMIGRIGAKSPYINGGYIPHLHFAIRKGRMGEPNDVFRIEPMGGKLFPMRMKTITEDRLVVEMDKSRPLTIPGIEVTKDTPDGPNRIEYPGWVMWTMYRTGFEIVGHTTDADPWLQPLRFLSRYGAVSNPAPFSH